MVRVSLNITLAVEQRLKPQTLNTVSKNIYHKKDHNLLDLLQVFEFLTPPNLTFMESL